MAALSACSGSPETLAPVETNTAYAVVPGWPVLRPGEALGQVSGVGVEASGDVLLFRRADRDWVGSLSVEPIAAPTLLGFDAASGALRRSLGAATFAMPHGLSVDGAGHLWVTDVALHQVFELDSGGKVLRTFGERGVPGDDAGHFDMPTDVAVAADGTFFVSDGYGNSRVAKFASDGTFLKSWGKAGSAPGEFTTPHNIALGPDGNVWVADRGNARVQIFDTEGTLKDVWSGSDLGRPWAVRFDKAGHVFIVDGGDQLPPPNRARVIELDLDRKVLATFGSYGSDAGQMIDPHDLSIADDGAIYVGEVGTGRRAQKFLPKSSTSP